MGFGFKDWLGEFYPKGLKPNKYLAYYSRIYNSVEIDSTFYRIPDLEKIKRWKNNTSNQFKISVKVPRGITHDAGLIGVEYEMKSFVESVRHLDEKLGVILIQFPAVFISSKIGVLADFIKQLPYGVRYAVEIRDSSWFVEEINQSKRTPELVDLLKTYNICWAATMYPGLPQCIYPTTSFLYVRWIGKHGQYPQFKKVRNNRQFNLAKWKSQIIDHLNGCSEVFGYFNNDYSGFSPETVNLFKSLVGLPIERFIQPIQEKLL